jgi:hypothetical protein
MARSAVLRQEPKALSPRESVQPSAKDCPSSRATLALQLPMRLSIHLQPPSKHKTQQDTVYNQN